MNIETTNEFDDFMEEIEIQEIIDKRMNSIALACK